MGGRQALGATLLVAGLGLVAVGVAGAAGAFRGPAASPVAVVPSDPPMVVPRPIPTATAQPTADVDGLVRTFFGEVEAALRAGRAIDLLDVLAPAVFERYGRAACQAELESRPAEPSRAFEIVAVDGPAPWDYETDGLATPILEAITVMARVTAPTPTGDETTERALHVQLVDGELRWFTDCGTPLG